VTLAGIVVLLTSISGYAQTITVLCEFSRTRVLLSMFVFRNIEFDLDRKIVNSPDMYGNEVAALRYLTIYILD
jgi:hypothetical protein